MEWSSQWEWSRRSDQEKSGKVRSPDSRRSGSPAGVDRSEEFGV